MNPKELSIFAIRDVKTLIEKIYPTGSIFEFRYERTSAIRSEEFYLKLFDIPKPKEIKAIKFPSSKLIEIIHKNSKQKGQIIVRSTTNIGLYFLLQNFQTGRQGYHWNNKFDRYRSLFLVYENLVKRKNYKFIAIRNCISHGKLENKKTIQYLKKLFGDENIDLNKRKHIKILKNQHEILLNLTEKALINYLLKLIKKSKERIGNFVIL